MGRAIFCDAVRQAVWNPILRKAAKDGLVPTVHGFTQKHPNWLHLRTNPGMQVITELLVEGKDESREILACCA
jgi:hypothetical protein